MKNHKILKSVLGALAIVAVSGVSLGACPTTPTPVPSGSDLVGNWTVDKSGYPTVTGNNTEVADKSTIEICNTSSRDRLLVNFASELLPKRKSFTVALAPGQKNTVMESLEFLDANGNQEGTLRLFLHAKEDAGPPVTWKMFGMFLVQPVSGSGDSGGTWGGGK